MKKCVVLAAMLVAGLGLAAGEWVVDPYRAVDVKWPKHYQKGKDFWMFLDTRWRERPGVAEERFVQASGLEMNIKSEPFILHFTRTISIRAVKAFGADGREVPVRAELSCDEKGAVCWTADDGSLVVSCDVLDPARKFTSAVGAFSVEGDSPFSRIEFRHGTPGGSRVATVENANVPASADIGGDFVKVHLKSPATAFSCDLSSGPLRVRYTDIADEAKWAAVLRERPFVLRSRWAVWPLLNAPDGTVDYSGLLRVERRYSETYAGIDSYEWDSNFMQKINHGPTGDLLIDMRYGAKIPCGRREMADVVRGWWRDVERAEGRRNIFGMSGGINFMQFAADFGARNVGYEITECVGGQTRIQHQIAFSAARQFGIPSHLYMAYFADQYTADSEYSIDPAKKAMGTRGTDWGTSPNYSSRCFYLGYYMGCNYLRFESQPNGQTIRCGEGRWALTGNGKVLKDVWEWSERPEGVRGEWYAPILLLKDRASISDGKYPLWQQPFAFYTLFPATEGDAYVDMVDQVVSPFENRRKFTDPSGGADLVNSEFADVFTSYIANPLEHGEITYEELSVYPVAMVLGDMNWSEKLCNTLKKYVAGGGTAVLTVAQAKPFDEAFTGFKPSGETVNSADGLVVAKGRVADGANVARKTSEGLPLFVTKDYFKGRVILVTSPNFRGTAKMPLCYKAPAALKELLLALQREVVPFTVDGTCEAVYNRMPDGSWKLLLVNNDGLAKATNETEEHYFPEYARKVTLGLPAGATAKEIRVGVPVEGSGPQTSITIPPGGVLVVDVKGVPDRARMPFDPKPEFSPVRNFSARVETSGLKNDGFRYDPEERMPKEKAPAVVGEWLAKNGFKDTSGNGRDLKVVGPVEFRDGVAVFAGNKPTFARLDHAKFKPTLYTGTLETWVKPDVNAKPLKGDKRGATFGVFTIGEGELMLASQGGRWALSAIGANGGNRRLDVLGPTVKPEWTHLCVTFDHGVANLYVNGELVRGVDGPMRAGRQCKNTFYDTLTVYYGSLVPSWGYFFRGEMTGLRFESRCLSAEEVKKRMEEGMDK